LGGKLTLGQTSAGEMWIAVGTHISMRPPHKAGRAAFPHPAPTLGV
jgi:hypothetical protein